MHPCEVPGEASIRTETSKLIIQIDLGARKGTGSASVEVWADCWQLVPCAVLVAYHGKRTRTRTISFTRPPARYSVLLHASLGGSPMSSLVP